MKVSSKKKRVISVMLSTIILVLSVMGQSAGIVHAAELENVFDYTIMALSTDKYIKDL